MLQNAINSSILGHACSRISALGAHWAHLDPYDDDQNHHDHDDHDDHEVYMHKLPITRTAAVTGSSSSR